MIIGDFRGMSKGVRFISYGIMAVCILVVILLLYSIVNDIPIGNIFGNQTANNTGTTGNGVIGANGTNVSGAGTGRTGGGGGRGSGGGGGGGGTPGGNPPGNNNTNQSNTDECSDRIDNDLDGAIDMDDFSCNPLNEEVINLTESTYSSQCQDGIDNDNDSLVDYPADSGCANNQDNLEDSTMSSVWGKLNDGLSLDNGRGIINAPYYNYDSEIVTHRDSAGNVLYFFTEDATQSLYVGRFNIQSKKWELFTFNGWSSQSTDIARPFSESLLFGSQAKLKLFNKASTIIGTLSTAVKTGILQMDVHGSVYGIKFDGQNMQYWTSGGYSSNNANALAYSFPGAAGYNSDLDVGASEGISVSVIGQYGEQGIGASRFDVATEQWRNWYNGAWNVQFTDDISMLPFYVSGSSVGSFVIKNLPQSSTFVLTYRYQTDPVTRTLRAAKYDGQQQKWFSWSGTSWTEQGTQQEVYRIGGSNEYARRKAFAIGSKIYTLFVDANVLNVITYDNTIPSWSAPQPLAAASEFVSYQENNKIWVVYKNQGTIYLRTFEGSWGEPETMGTNMQATSLAGLSVVNGNPLVFVTELSGGERRLYTLGDISGDAWSGTARTPAAFPSSITLDSVHGTSGTQWDTEVQMSVINPSTGQVVQFNSEYGTQACGHLAFDSELNLYCPKITTSGVAIFPNGYVAPSSEQVETAHQWGSFFDYFLGPSSAAVDNAGNKVYIIDQPILGGGGNLLPPRGRIQVWDKQKNNENIAFNPSSTQSSWFAQSYYPVVLNYNLNGPSDLAIDEQNRYLYVTETRSNRVLRYPIDNQGIVGGAGGYTVIGSEGTGDGQFKYPQGIDIDSQGNIYVVDTNNNRVEVFDKNGVFVRTWGSVGTGDGQFIYPYAIAVDKVKNYVYVTDPYNNRIQIFKINANSVDFVYSFNAWDSTGVVKDFVKVTGIAADNNVLIVSSKGAQNSARLVKFQMTLL